ncbi:Signal transduction histidine-protein kinase BaeS [Streptomyces sp. ADI95-17]|nr:Signal transduction histidine-protein kinase BaeS [Streptomyces sp. ADI95-17]
MRWALVRVCLAVTVMVVVAFAVPLGLVVKEMASDRAFSNAERQAAAIGPTLSITTDREQLSRAMLSTDAGLAGRMALHIPADDEASELEIGRGRAVHDELDAIRELGRSGILKVLGGSALLAPIALDSGTISIVEVYVPDADVTNGVTTAWIVLAGVGIALVVGSVAVADRLGVRLTQPAERLAGAAHELGEGMLGVRVPEDGPTELRQAAAAFNSMADQVVQLLANERELAADLSHRLRTPLTVLRLNAASDTARRQAPRTGTPPSSGQGAEQSTRVTRPLPGRHRWPACGAFSSAAPAHPSALPYGAAAGVCRGA